MISRITGTIVESSERSLVIETGGIGYLVHTASGATTGSTLTLYTHMIIKDDAHELYGFERSEEKSLFSILISVSGVGPKTALQMLTLYPLSELVGAIKGGDAKAISQVPGIGKKTAERVVIDLKDKLDAFDSVESVHSDLIEALISLGYKEFQIRNAITDIDTNLPIEKQITTALQRIQK